MIALEVITIKYAFENVKNFDETVNDLQENNYHLLDWGSYADIAELNAKKLVKNYKDNPTEVNAQIVEIAQNNNVPVA